MRKAFLTALGAALLAVACSDPTAPPPPTLAPPTITETFSGTLGVQSNNVHRFTVQQPGGLKVTVTSVDPSAAVGIGVGTPSTATGTCSLLSSIPTVAGPAVQLDGNATVSGNFCVAVFDAGNLVESVTYTVVVLHS